MALTLTSGGESRLDGAPDQLLPPFADGVEALAQAILADDTENVYGGDINLARQIARQQLGEMSARSRAGQAAASQAGADRNRTRAARRAGGRPVGVEEAEQDAYGGYADTEIGDMRNPVGRGMQSRGPTLGSEAWDAQSLRHNAADLPYQSADEQGLREEYLRRFGRPPRTREEVDFMRGQMEDEAQERMGGAGTWGAQEPFKSEDERDAYRQRTPSQYSQEQLDMMQVQGGGMGSPQGWVLVYDEDTGSLKPMQRAPAPSETTTRPREPESFVRNPGGWLERDEGGGFVNQPGASNAATGGQRVGPAVDSMEMRPGLRNPAMEREGYEPRWMEGPQGGEWVYDLTPQERGRRVRDRDTWQERQRRQRLAMRTGRSPQEAAAAVGSQYKAEGRELSFEDQLRMEGDLARMQNQKNRKSRVAEQAMMAGGQPTGGPFGTRATTTAINQLGPGWREIALLDRLTEGRRGGATPLDVQAQQMGNSLPVMRSAVAGMMQDMDPAASADRMMQRQIMLAQMPPEQRTALSIQMGEPMGTGYSAAHVGGRWNYWMNNFGGRPVAWRDQNFRMEMEGLGYSPGQIDEWIDRRRDFEGGAPPAAPDPTNPGGLPPGMVPP